MNQFFAHPTTFIRLLREREGETGACWSCVTPKTRLLVLNVVKDLRLLGLRVDDCPWAIRLCPACDEAYRVTFNARFSARGGDRSFFYQCKTSPVQQTPASSAGFESLKT
jgi:hypothetical protein